MEGGAIGAQSPVEAAAPGHGQKLDQKKSPQQRVLRAA